MDDDIDIEEHDVLDNPRIKSMFPDLSCVKIEIPDDEDEQQIEEQYGILEPAGEPQEMMYQYEYSFETTTDNIPEYVQEESQGGLQEEMEEEYIDEEEEEDANYFYNNEIILGSKSAPNLDQLYDEALNSHAIVYLENWEIRLKSSPCFCNTCEILFPTVNALDAHKMVSHSYLVAMDTSHRENTARKSTVTSKYCNHCAKTFPDDTSLIKHLYELLPLNNFSKVKEEKKEPQKKKLATSMPWPKKVKSTSHVITKLHTKKIKLEPREIKIEPEEKTAKTKFKTALSRDGKFFAASSLVPKSTLFQCNVCQVGFLSCFGASQHAKSCRKVSLFKKCGICKRKIRTRDVKTHELQHSYTDKLKIYTMNKSIYERVLCKCPKCLACLDELAFWAHYPNCKKSDKKSAYCPDCDINVALCRFKNHRLKHSVKKLTKKDFIVVEFYDQKEMSVADADEDIKRMERKERLKMYKQKYHYRKRMSLINEEIKVYYCEHCGCCQCRLNYKGHTDGLCKRTLPKKYCEKCGLCFTSKSIESHLNLHEKRSFSLKDISVISLTTGKSIDTPIANFYECRECFKHFLYRRSIRVHDCKTEKYITCKVCMKKFNIQAYKIHKIFHSVDKLMPELMKKYNLINNMWNIMYMCVSCELVTMTYDAAVTHSQGHLNYIISDLHKHCVVCDLRIAEKEFSLHEKLHTNNDSIERESFKILKYNYEDLFKKEWMDLFEDLPEIHKVQILSKSIYRFTRSVKMHIEIKASTNDTKYFCVNCNTFIDGATIRQHIKSKCSKNNKLVCNICHEVFKTLKQFLSHEGSHENEPKRQTIVTFNNECDKEFNNHLNLIESDERMKTKDVPLSILREKLLSDNVKANCKLYKCAKCETCLTLRGSVSRHRCVFNTKRRFCEICQQYFCAKKTALHAEAHRKKPHLTKDSFYIVYFNTGGKTVKTAGKKDFTAKVTSKISPKTEVTPKTSAKMDATPKVSPKKVLIAKIFECQCGLHFTSMKTVEKHLEQCSPKLEVSKETCSKCELVFPTDVLVTHLVNHHHKETKIVIQKVARAYLFKCPHCSVNFRSVENYDLHTEKCDSRNSYLCKNCGLRYGKKCFHKHLCSTGDVTYLNKVTIVRKKTNTIKESVVYRCVPCDLTYLQRNSFRYHAFEVNHNLKKEPTTCEVCGLKFTNCALRKHMNIHSFPNEEYKIKVVDPVGGDFIMLTGSNRGKDDGDSRRKRKSEIAEESHVVKKMKTRLSDLDTPLTERRSFNRAFHKPSTSKASKMDFDDAPSENIVPDEISIYTNETEDASNVSDVDNDTSGTYSKTMKEVDKNGLSSRVKSRILVNTYGNKLYKCPHCHLHYMKKESFVYHVNRNPGPHDMSDKYKCDVCDIEFSKCTLPRHKYVHHDEMGLKREDFVILLDPLNKPDEFSQELEVANDSDILDVTAESHYDTASENDSVNETKTVDIVNDSDNFDTERISNVDVSENCDTERISNVDVSENCDTERISNVDVSENFDTERISNVDVSENCDTERINDVNVSDNCDTERLSDVNVSDNCDTERLSDINVSDNCDANSEINENVSETDKICYYKCSDCNVCFVDQKMCFEHTLKHDILDPKTYIQCKICDFQFLIDSLKEHMVLHHTSDFLIERLTIYEYKSSGIGSDPKIDMYQAVDKLQSRLVSTTTDVGII